MYTNVAASLNNINTVRAKKGVKVVNMANKDFNFEVEPTNEELNQIAMNEKKMGVFEKKYIHSDITDVNTFGHNEVDFYFKQIGGVEICTPEEEIEYFKKIADGDVQAREEFIERNLKLVISIARHNNQQNPSFSMMDLIQEGNIGLLKAVERFDVSKGYRFSTYATWWIRQTMCRAIADQARTIRIPVHMVEWINKYKRMRRDFFQVNGREPTLDEVANELGVSIEKANEIVKKSQEPISLSTPIGEGDASTLEEFMESNEISVEEQYERKETAIIINEMLSSLTEREQRILKARFGIGINEPKTLEEIGKVFNVTRERIRQVEAKAIRSLKRNCIKTYGSAFAEEYLN